MTDKNAMPNSPVISLHPDELELASTEDWNIELKLDWEDMTGETGPDREISDLLEENNIDKEQLVDVHLPPGTSSSNPGMSATRENIGAITDFSYNQLSGLADPFMTTHPPKKFRYLDQLWVFHDLFENMEHEVSIENTSDESDWYTPEAVAFFGFVGDQYSSFDNLSLTIDSAHLPQDDYVHQNFDQFYNPDNQQVRDLMNEAEASNEWLFEIDYDRVEDIVQDINEDLGEEDNTFPTQYLSYMGKNFQDAVESYFPDEEGLITNDSLTGDPYLPLLRTLSMTGERVKSVHLNDPERNDVPTLDDYRDSEALQKSIEYLNDNDTYIVLEPETEIDHGMAEDYLDDVSTMMERSS